MRLLLCLAALLHLATVGLCQAKPNVLFIMADDFRTDLGVYGSAAKTPVLDALAARSMVFDRSYCQQAVCNPSRSSMLTGMRPDTLGLWNNSVHFRELKPDVVTLPQAFKNQGWTARCVGKIFHNWHTAVKGDPGSWSAPEFLHFANHGHDAPQHEGELPPNLATLIDLRYNTGPLCECRDVSDEAYYDGRVAAEAVKVLGSFKADEPFFLAVGFWKPHAPFNAPKKYWDLYEREQLPALNPARPSGAPELAFHSSTEILGTGDNALKPNAAQMQEMRHGYLANISYLDAQVGKVLAALAKHPAAERTIVVFVADHGYHLGEHGLWGKTSCFELDARVPLMIQAPGMKPGRTDALAELIDLFPTLVDLTEVKGPSGLDGRSLKPVLIDPKASLREAAISQHPRPSYYDRTPSKTPEAMGYSARTAEVRYTEWRDWKTGQIIAKELYDSAKDPAELTNRADDPILAAQQARAAELLRATCPMK